MQLIKLIALSVFLFLPGAYALDIEDLNLNYGDRSQRSVPIEKPSDDCHPDIDENKIQYIIGYGSLMEAASKRRTTSEAGENIPAEVRGFSRGWYINGSEFAPTTFLAVYPEKNPNLNTMVAAVYRVFNAGEIKETDAREEGYCRQLVPAAQVTMLDKSPTPEGQIWMYVIEKSQAKSPSKKFPIVQSYVDIFVKGCMEIESKFRLDNFKEGCIKTTHGWSTHWVNDRIYPRRPFIYEPQASAIDKVLKKNVGKYFKARVIE